MCCVGLTITASADFAIDKPASVPCPNLLGDYGCGIHSQLRDRGFSGCTTYDCYGAGQKVSQVVFEGRSWREAPETAQRMFQSLPPRRELHQLLWFLTEALDRQPGPALARAIDDAKALGNSDDELSWGDVDRLARSVMPLLHNVSAAVRAAARRHPQRTAGADLRGVDLRGQNRAGQDLTNADLRGADLMDTDLRRADLSGADLTDAVFLTQSQLNSANGSSSTLISSPLTAPRHWFDGPAIR